MSTPSDTIRPSPRVLIDTPRLAKRVAALAGDVAATFPPDFTLVVVMKGAMVFAADLMRALHGHGARPRLEFMWLSSYGAGTVSSGMVRDKTECPDVTGCDVLLVDDIADSGRSLSWARERLLAAGANRVSVCALLDKPSRRVVEVPLDHIGFSIDDLFVVGYGIDFAEDHRYLPWIGVIDM